MTAITETLEEQVKSNLKGYDFQTGLHLEQAINGLGKISLKRLSNGKVIAEVEEEYISVKLFTDAQTEQALVLVTEKKFQIK